MSTSFDVLVERIIERQGISKEEWRQRQQHRMDELNKRLAKEWEDQQVTEEILNKRCTL